MKKQLQKMKQIGLQICLLAVTVVSTQAQNQVYWREGFETEHPTKPCNITSTAPTAGNIAATAGYYQGNAGQWYVYGAYRTTGSASNNCSGVITTIGINHLRFSNQVTAPDSAYAVTPIVNAGVKEFHFLRSRSGRSYSIWYTSDTLATTPNWTLAAFIPNSTTTCVDTAIMVNSATAKRVKIVTRPANDSDIDSVWVTSFSPITSVKSLNTETYALNVYPTITNSILNFDIEAVSDFQIVNLLGQVVLTGKANAQYVDVSALKTGTYILKMDNRRAKFIKQ